MRLALVVSSAVLLMAGCGPEEGQGNGLRGGEVVTSPPGPHPAPPLVNSVSDAERAALESRDCREVVEGYVAAIERKAFDIAILYWDRGAEGAGAGADADGLTVRYGGYAAPRITIADVMQEGAAGSLYCTVTGALSDAGNPDTALREGKITLRRVNDVPGATPAQLRWTIRSSTFLEQGGRAGTGEPA